MTVSVNKAGNGDPPGDPDFEEIDIAEEELIDAYVRDELSFDERKLLEKGLRTSPELVERLHFARLLADAADGVLKAEPSSDRSDEKFRATHKKWWPFGLSWTPRPAFGLALATCALILVLAGVGLLTGWLRLRRERQQLVAQQAAAERQKLEVQKSLAEERMATDRITADLREKQQELEATQQQIDDLTRALNQKRAAPVAIASLFLPPISRSSAAPTELKPAAGTSQIKLQLGVESIDYRRYRVELKDSQGKQILQQNVGPPRAGRLVTIVIPRKLVPPNTYSLQLSGISLEGTREPVGNYSFRIVGTARDN